MAAQRGQASHERHHGSPKLHHVALEKYSRAVCNWLGVDCKMMTSYGLIQGSAADTQEMAIPMQRYMMPPLMQQPSQQPLQNPMELLAAMEGWDPMRMYNMTHLTNPMGGEVGPLEGAGRMSQSGGVMGRTMPPRPQQAGRSP